MKNIAFVGAVVALGVAAAGPAMAAEGKSAGDILLRVRAIGLLPQEKSNVQTLGGKVDVSNQYAPEIDLTYFLTDKVALELIAATTRHRVKDKGSTSGDLDLGKVSLLPPTLTLQYHPLPKADFSPYVGAGINYTVFYDEKAGADVTAVDYENNFGGALQVGVDYRIAPNLYLNADVKKLFLSTSVKLNGGAIRADVDLDPWVVGVGVGYKF